MSLKTSSEEFFKGIVRVKGARLSLPENALFRLSEHKRMSKMTKRMAIGFAVLIGIVLLTSLALEFILDLNSYNGTLTALVENALHRKVTLGNISHTLLRGPGAKMQDITIFEPNKSDFFVQVKDIIASVKILPLLSKRFEVAKILLEQPVVTIKRDQQGGWNFDDLLAKPAEAATSTPQKPVAGTPPVQKTPAAAAGTPGATPPAVPTPPPAENAAAAPPSAALSQFAVDLFRLSNGTVRFVDEFAKVTTELSSITGDVSGIAVDSPIRFQLAANVDGGSQGKFKASGKIGPFPADGKVDNLDVDVTAQFEQIDLAHFEPYYQVAQLQEQVTATDAGKLNATINLAGNVGKQLASDSQISVNDVNVDVSGTVQEAKTAPKLDLTISSQELPWEKLLQILPPALAKQLQDLGLSGLGNLKIQPKGSLDNLTIAGAFDLSKSGLRYQNLFAKPETVATALTFETTLKAFNALDIAALKLTLGDLTVNVSGSVKNFNAPVLDLQLASNDFPLDKLAALFPDFSAAKASGSDQKLLKASGTGVLRASAKGALDNLALQVTLNCDKSDLTYSNFFTKSPPAPTNLTIEAQLGKDAVTIGKFLVQLGELQLTTTGKIENFAQPRLNLVIETNAFDLQALLAHLPIAKASLPKELTLAGTGKLRLAPTGALDDLTVAGAVDLSKGEIGWGETFRKPKDIPSILEFDVSRKKDAVDIRRFQLNLNGVILDIKGLISGLAQETKADVTVKSNKFALNQLLLPVQGMKFNPTGSVELNLAIKTPLAKFDLAALLTGTFRLTDVGLPLPQLSKPVEHLNALVQIQGETLTLQNFAAAMGESAFKGNVKIARFLTAPDVTFDLQAPQLNLDELMLPPAKNAENMGQAAETVVDIRTFQARPSQAAPFLLVAAKKATPKPKPTPAPGKKVTPTPTVAPASAPKAKEPPRTAEKSPPAAPLELPSLQKITVNGTVQVARGQAQKIKFADLSADVNMQQGVLNVENLLFSLYDGKYQGFVKLDLNTPDPKYELHSELVQVDSNPLLRDSASVNDVVYGLLFANVSVQGQGFAKEQLVKTLAGKGAIKLEKGKFTKLDVWPQLASAFQLLGSLGKVKELAQIGDDLSRFPAGTQFSRFEGNFELNNGSAGSSDLILEMLEQNMYLTIVLNGKFGLDASLDFTGKVRFAPQSKYYNDVERTFRDFKQADGSIELPFPIPIGGTLLKPEINMQSVRKSLAALAVEMAKQAVKSQVEQAVKDKVGAQVLDLLQGKKPAAAPSPTPASEQPQEQQAQPTPTPKPKPEKILEEVGKNLLQDLFGGNKKK